MMHGGELTFLRITNKSVTKKKKSKHEQVVTVLTVKLTQLIHLN